MKLLAITSCPSGVAHTYMAAEALQKAAKKRGIEIKVETQGLSLIHIYIIQPLKRYYPR